MENVVKQVYRVMHKYACHFSETGILENLDAWVHNKRLLVEILSRHPNWNERELGIIFESLEFREKDEEAVFADMRELVQMVDNPGVRTRFSTALRGALIGCNTSLTEDNVRDIKDMVPEIKCAEGMKTSRAVNRICEHFEVNRADRYNSVFAHLSDALNPLSQQRKAVLSVHPCDYLEMSNRDNSWSSCHNLDDGGYCTGTLSYLCDGTSMVFYTVDSDAKDYFYEEPKRTRQMFFYHNGKLLQSRLYPSSDENLITQYRHLVQEAFATCLGVPDSWRKISKRIEINKHFETFPGSKHYADYEHCGTLSLQKSLTPRGKILIGHSAYCVACGEKLNSEGSLKCACKSQAVCSDCGKTVGDPVYFEGTFLCTDCLKTCAKCGCQVHGNMKELHIGGGEVLNLCPTCHSQAFVACESCSVRSICDSSNQKRWCPRIAEGVRVQAA